jgi:hypothetical protein
LLFHMRNSNLQMCVWRFKLLAAAPDQEPLFRPVSPSRPMLPI